MESISVFDMFKIGVGPSSSHTMGPWKALLICLESFQENHSLSSIIEIKVHLYGSLAKTGKGHGTDLAVLMGIMGEQPDTTNIGQIPLKIANVHSTNTLMVLGKKEIAFNPKRDIIFHFDRALPYHANGMKVEIFHHEGTTTNTYYSIGGGFVVKEGEDVGVDSKKLPYPIEYASDLKKYCADNGWPIWKVVMENEKMWREEEEIKEGVLRIWDTMKNCIFHGCHTEGELPGGLKVKRRASFQNKKLIGKGDYANVQEWIGLIKKADHSFKETLNWVSCFALSVNEENASFGRVVTAPTNGAAGVIPAVLMYYICFCEDVSDEDIIHFLLVAGEIGSIFKKRATISAAMGGCQAEIGVSAAMAAAALTECTGGSPQRALMAAEIAMEHHLGLTCDPIGGLVQIPCIERNAIGAMKAITASQIALASDPEFAKVSLDDVIKAMWNTAEDMNVKYKETSEGGLAINIPVSLPEC